MAASVKLTSEVVVYQFLACRIVISNRIPVVAVKVDVGCYLEIRVGIISVAIVNILGNLSQLLGSLYEVRRFSRTVATIETLGCKVFSHSTV